MHQILHDPVFQTSELGRIVEKSQSRGNLLLVEGVDRGVSKSIAKMISRCVTGWFGVLDCSEQVLVEMAVGEDYFGSGWGHDKSPMSR